MAWYVLTETASLEGERLDSAIVRCISEIPSRSFGVRLIEHGSVRINGKVSKPSCRIRSHDLIEVDLSFLDSIAPEPTPEPIPLQVLFEDNDCLVIEKPIGMVVHPGAGISSGTLVNAVLAHCGTTLPTLGGPERAGIVHRLDRDTSGIMVVAKSQLALTELSRQFAEHQHIRIYWTLVYGKPENHSGKIVTWHGRDPRNRLKFAVLPEGQGKRAALGYRVLQSWCDNKISLIECQLETGRTHQIRVQMTSLGHPIIGDTLYGSMPSSVRDATFIAGTLRKMAVRQLLHAKFLSFRHPRNGEQMTFTSELPPDFTRVLSFLNENAISKALLEDRADD